MTQPTRPALATWVLTLLAITACACAGQIEGKVVSVYDGDTITVLDAVKNLHKIRLSGIDAPELGQAYARVAREHLAGQIAGRMVVIDWSKRDKYQRVVGKILLDGKDINITQIEAGFAWHYKMYANEQPHDDQAQYAQAELVAQETRRGLWQEKNPIPPWEYRLKMRQ